MLDALLVDMADVDDFTNSKKIENEKYIFARANDIAGPTSLISKNASDADRKLAAKLILTYTKTPKE
jgi:hypothetical protein